MLVKGVLVKDVCVLIGKVFGFGTGTLSIHKETVESLEKCQFLPENPPNICTVF